MGPILENDGLPLPAKIAPKHFDFLFISRPNWPATQFQLSELQGRGGKYL